MRFRDEKSASWVALGLLTLVIAVDLFTFARDVVHRYLGV